MQQAAVTYALPGRMATRHAHMPVRGKAHLQVHHAAASEQYGLALRLSSITVERSYQLLLLLACLRAWQLGRYGLTRQWRL